MFSQLDSATIRDAIIDGVVTGRHNSHYVGGIAGHNTNKGIIMCLNLADITGESATSIVGGIVGESYNSFFDGVANNGTITGGQYVGGIAGRLIWDYCEEEPYSSKYMSNAGTIQGNNTIIEDNSYIAGIVAFVNSKSVLSGLVNIGEIKGQNFDYVGGIVAYNSGCSLSICSNAGIIEGGTTYTGGIVGCLRSGEVKSCINTN